MRDFAHVRILNVKRHPLGVILGAVARALIGGGGGCIFIYSCYARRISFEINLKTTDFKRNPSGITRIYE